eukprot:2903830-Karenia_brevis.AAC.1
MHCHRILWGGGTDQGHPKQEMTRWSLQFADMSGTFLPCYEERYVDQCFQICSRACLRPDQRLHPQ